MAAVCSRCRLESENTTPQSIEHIRAHYAEYNSARSQPVKARAKKASAKAEWPSTVYMSLVYIYSLTFQGLETSELSE